MSVTTTADERFASAMKHIREAISDLLIVADPNTYGSDQYKRGLILNMIVFLQREFGKFL